MCSAKAENKTFRGPEKEAGSVTRRCGVEKMTVVPSLTAANRVVKKTFVFFGPRNEAWKKTEAKKRLSGVEKGRGVGKKTFRGQEKEKPLDARLAADR